MNKIIEDKMKEHSVVELSDFLNGVTMSNSDEMDGVYDFPISPKLDLILEELKSIDESLAEELYMEVEAEFAFYYNFNLEEDKKDKDDW